MAMLEITCEHCGRGFRVRREFAGKSTRCPGCSKPLTIGSMAPEAPPVRNDWDDAPKPRRRAAPPPSDSISLSPEWKKTVKAIGNEQAAVRFLGVQVLADIVGFCVGRSIGPMNQIPAIFIVLFILLMVGPAAMAVIMGLLARFGALNVPSESNARGTAWASIACAVGGMFAIVLIGFSLLISLDGNVSNRDGAMFIGVFMGFLLTAGAVVTFAALVAQIGIVTSSREISAGIGRMGIGLMVCILITVVFGGCISILSEGFSSRRYDPYGGGYSSGPDLDGLFAIAGFMGLISSGIMLVLYHSLLGNAKTALTTSLGMPK